MNMSRNLTRTLILVAALVAGGLFAFCTCTANIKPETGMAIVVVIAVLMVFNSNRNGGRMFTWVPGRFRIPPFYIVVFMIGVISYFSTYEYLAPRYG